MRIKHARVLGCLLWAITSLLLVPSLALSAQVSLEQKIGQMLVVGFQGLRLSDQQWLKQALDNQHVGGVVLFDYGQNDKERSRNIRDPQQLKHLTTSLQRRARIASERHRNQLYPLFIAVDYEGGLVNRLKPHYGFPAIPSAAKMGQMKQQQVENYAQVMARTLKQMGINLNLAPIVDVNVNPDNPVIGQLGRSFSNEPAEVTFYASILSRAMAAHGILCTYKHFPGHGSSQTDIHQEMVNVSRTWQQQELQPYRQLLQKDQHCPVVMAGHIVNKQLDDKGRPASLSPTMIQTILRDQLGFQGLIMSDDLQMQALAKGRSLQQRVTQAINAGNDLLIISNQAADNRVEPDQIINIVKKQVHAGRIDRQRINAAYARIKHYKQKLQHQAN